MCLCSLRSGSMCLADATSSQREHVCSLCILESARIIHRAARARRRRQRGHAIRRRLVTHIYTHTQTLRAHTQHTRHQDHEPTPSQRQRLCDARAIRYQTRKRNTEPNRLARAWCTTNCCRCCCIAYSVLCVPQHDDALPHAHHTNTQEP